jgi:hypothetical protein
LGLALVISPKEFFEYLQKDSSYAKPFVFSAISLLISYVLSSIINQDGITFVSIIILTIVSLIIPFLGASIWLVILLMERAGSSRFGGQTFEANPDYLPTPSFINIFKVYCYSSVILALYGVVSVLTSLYSHNQWLSFIPLVISLFGNIHFLILMIIGLNTYEKFTVFQIITGWLLNYGLIYLIFQFLIIGLLASYFGLRFQ